jgi:glycosyltransferase involved in cell wall biosynthesis
MSLDFTIVIPTYNGAERLPKLLTSLQKQINIEHLPWEIIIIDNNSTDNTANLIKSYQENWNYPYKLKYFIETNQGIAYARAKGIKEAKGKYIGFLDDDNIPDKNWIFAAYNFLENHPQCGAVGGKIHGNFATELPANFDRIKAFLAIYDHGENPHLFEPDNLILPAGAGLVVSKKVWVENVPSKLNFVGRISKEFVSGDDYESLLYIHKAGWEIWYNPVMQSYHQIPAFRLEKDYLFPLSKGCGLPTCTLRMINAKSWQKPIIIIRTLLGNLRRMIIHKLKYGGKLDHDLIAACEMQFYWGSFLSVFYYLRKNVHQDLHRNQVS